MSEPRKICSGGIGPCCADCRFWVGRLPDSEPLTEHMQWIKPDPCGELGCANWKGDEPAIADWMGAP